MSNNELGFFALCLFPRTICRTEFSLSDRVTWVRLADCMRFAWIVLLLLLSFNLGWLVLTRAYIFALLNAERMASGQQPLSQSQSLKCIISKRTEYEFNHTQNEQNCFQQEHSSNNKLLSKWYAFNQSLLEQLLLLSLLFRFLVSRFFWHISISPISHTVSQKFQRIAEKKVPYATHCAYLRYDWARSKPTG